MCKKFLLVLSCFLTIIISIILLKQPPPDTVLLEEKLESSQLSDIDSDLLLVIDKINKFNNSIIFFECEKLEVKIWENLFKLKLNGSLQYQKTNFFRLELNSIFGKELDLGSNESIFWYWSKRDIRPGVYWAYYGDFNKTRLKNPFNPMFVRATLGFEEIKINDALFFKNKDNYILSYKRLNSSGEKIIFSIIINKTNKQVDGFVISNENGKNLAACEIKERQDNFPTKILYKWNEENKIMSINIKKYCVNKKINEKKFHMPNLGEKINLAYE